MMKKRRREYIRPIRYPRLGKDAQQGAAYRNSEEIFRMNKPAPARGIATAADIKPQ